MGEPVRFRRHTWGNPETGETLHGIQARVGLREWVHVYRDHKPLLFTDPEDREAKLADLRKRARHDATTEADRG